MVRCHETRQRTGSEPLPLSRAMTPTEATAQAPPSRAKAVILYLLFCFVSTGFFFKNFGLPGVAAYAAAVAVLGTVWWKLREPVGEWLGRRHALWAGLFATGLVGLFAVAYPLENGKGPGKSSDRDDGLNIAVSRMVGGEYPYYESHPNAGPLSVFPGAILLATPFVLLGNSAYQNLAWIAVFLWLTSRLYGRRGEVLLLGAAIFGLCPALLYEFVSGGDLLANGIYVAVALWWFTAAWADRAGIAPRLLSAAFLGIALASRPNFLLLLPLAGAALWRWNGLRHAMAGCALAVMAAATLTLPFYLAAPGRFTPLVAGNKLALLNQHVAWGGVAIEAISVVAAVAAGVWLLVSPRMPERIDVFRVATLVTAVPMIATVAAYSSIHRTPDFSFMHPRYGLMYLFLALWGWGLARPCGFCLTRNSTAP